MKSFKQHLNEMSMHHNDNMYNELSDENTRKTFYKHTKDDYVEKKIDKNITLHHNMISDRSGVRTNYHTNDNSKGETIHRAQFLTKQPTTELPFKHDEQIEVRKQQDNKDLPKGYAADIAYHHFETSKYPLKSSSEQTTGGHKLWKNLAHRALAEGHHVYFHDGEKLNKSTPANIDEHLRNYHGGGYEYGNKHIIISKEKLT